MNEQLDHAVEQDGGPSKPKLTEAERVDYIWSSHSHMCELIKNCDFKASLILAWCTAIIGGLFAAEFQRMVTGTHSSLAGATSWTVGWIQFCALVSLISLAVSFLLSVWAVAPRYSSPKWGTAKEGFIYWDAILAHGNETQFATFIVDASPDAFLAHISEHLFRLARIAKVKHRVTSWAILFATMGSVLAALAIFVT